MNKPPTLYLVTVTEEDTEMFLGVFSSYKKAERFVLVDEYEKYPFLRYKEEKNVEMDTRNIRLYCEDGKQRNYYISKLKVDEPYEV